MRLTPITEHFKNLTGQQSYKTMIVSPLKLKNHEKFNQKSMEALSLNRKITMRSFYRT